MRRKVAMIAISLLLGLGLIVGACTTPQAPSTSAPKPSTPASSTATAKPTYDWKFLTPYTGTHIAMDAVREFVSMVEQRSNGRIKFTLFEGGALAKAAEQFQAISTGVSEAGQINSTYYVGKVPAVAGLNLLWAPPTDKWKQAFREFQPFMEQAHQPVGIKSFYPVARWPYAIVAKQPIKTKEDLKGKLVRNPGGILGAQVAWAGGTAVQTTGYELYDALQKGVIDLTWLTYRTISAQKLYEIAPYITWSKLASVTDVPTLFNLKAWNSLPADLQKVIDDTAYEVATRSVDRIDADIDGWAKEMKDVRVTFSELPLEWKGPMLQVGGDKYLADAGDLGKKIWAVYEKYSK